jgi:glycosyltransferase involved in cell wall biosynthesis
MTRCFKRPKQLERCIASLQNQTDQDYEHLLIHDNVGNGLFWANKQIHLNADKVNGRWVYVLDDDDWLTDSHFIEDLKKIESPSYDIIICKGYIGEGLYPLFWKKAQLRGTIGSPNFIVKKHIFLTNSIHWCKPKAADFFFFQRAYGNANTYWWNKIVFKAPIGNGMPE